MLKHTVAILNFGGGNLHSVAQAVKASADEELRVVLAKSAQDVHSCDRIIFPGVGAIKTLLDAIRSRDLAESIQWAADNRPVLGVCLGLHALVEHSEENGGQTGLGLLRGRCAKLPAKDSQGAQNKVPHMGWSQTALDSHPVFAGLGEKQHFYYSHSYAVDSTDVDPNQIHARVEPAPGIHIAAGLGEDNLIAVQFHPEKSGWAGLRLYRNFLNWEP